MKTPTYLIFAASLFALMSNELSAKQNIDVDVDKYRVRLQRSKSEFVPCSPHVIDRKSIERGWRYVLRYMHNDPAEGGLSFSLMLVRTQKTGQFVLALEQAKDLTIDQFDKADDEEKIRLATVTKVIDQAFAQSLYESWIDALLRARFPDDSFGSTGPEYYYLSAFSFDTGYMCAIASSYQSGKTTGMIRETGLLLKNYLEEPNPEKIKQIEAEIREKLRSEPTGHQ